MLKLLLHTTGIKTMGKPFVTKKNIIHNSEIRLMFGIYNGKTVEPFKLSVICYALSPIEVILCKSL